MSDLIRTILKWILVIILTILIILLIIGIANHNSKEKSKNQPVQAIEKIKLEEEAEETITEEAKEQENTLIIDVQDTASKRDMTLWIGIFILGGTFYYLYKNHQISE